MGSDQEGTFQAHDGDESNVIDVLPDITASTTQSFTPANVTLSTSQLQQQDGKDEAKVPPSLLPRPPLAPFPSGHGLSFMDPFTSCPLAYGRSVSASTPVTAPVHGSAGIMVKPQHDSKYSYHFDDLQYLSTTPRNPVLVHRVRDDPFLTDVSSNKAPANRVPSYENDPPGQSLATRTVSYEKIPLTEPVPRTPSRNRKLGQFEPHGFALTEPRDFNLRFYDPTSPTPLSRASRTRRASDLDEPLLVPPAKRTAINRRLGSDVQVHALDLVEHDLLLYLALHNVPAEFVTTHLLSRRLAGDWDRSQPRWPNRETLSRLMDGMVSQCYLGIKQAPYLKDDKPVTAVARLSQRRYKSEERVDKMLLHGLAWVRREKDGRGNKFVTRRRDLHLRWKLDTYRRKHQGKDPRSCVDAIQGLRLEEEEKEDIARLPYVFGDQESEHDFLLQQLTLWWTPQAEVCE